MGKGKDKGKEPNIALVVLHAFRKGRDSVKGKGEEEPKGKGKGKDNDKGKGKDNDKGKGKDKGKDEVDAFLASLVDNRDAGDEFFLSEELEAAGRSPSRSRSPRVMFSATRFPSS